QRLLDRHQARVVRESARRRNALLAALERRMPSGVSWTESQGGFSLLVTLPEDMDSTSLLERAIARGVTFTPGTAFFVDRGGEQPLRLSVPAIRVTQVDEGVKRLAETIREAPRQPERAAHARALRAAGVTRRIERSAR